MPLFYVEYLGNYTRQGHNNTVECQEVVCSLSNGIITSDLQRPLTWISVWYYLTSTWWKVELWLPWQTDRHPVWSVNCCHFQQELWLPGLADTVCPRPPLMTQVQHFVSWIKKSRDETYRRCELMTLTFDLGGHRDCLSYASWYFVRVPSANFGDTTTVRFWFMGHTAQTDYVTLTFDLGGHGACDWCRSSSSIRIPIIKFEVRSPCHSEDTAHDVCWH